MKAAFKGAAVASAVAALFATAHAESPAPAKEKASKVVHCDGANACKGQSACATKDTGCAGMNACKGKGWVQISEKECKEKGGKVVAEE